jgi:hypothetical protein
MILEYVNLPKIPDILLPKVQDIIDSPRYPSIIKHDLFQTRQVNDSLLEWLSKHVHVDFTPRFQLMYNGHPIHKDVSRKACYNYLLDTGGDNAKTIVFDESKTKVIKSLHIPVKTWYYLNTTLFHTVTHITTVRVALSLTINDD